MPPLHHLKDFTDTYIGECGGEDTELARASFFQFVSRDEDTMLVPFYDMLNHSNDPQLLNTNSKKPEEEGQPFLLRATRDIGPGEQIFNTYNRCHQCWPNEDEYEHCDFYSHYGTTEVFDIFGFVEDFPQYWKLNMNIGSEEEPIWDDYEFCLEKPDNNGPFALSNLEGSWPGKEQIEYLGKELVRLVELKDTLMGDEELKASMPEYEWDTAWRYHQALMTSISSALIAYNVESWEDDSEDDSEDDDSEDAELDEPVSAGEKLKRKLNKLKGQDKRRDWDDEL